MKKTAELIIKRMPLEDLKPHEKNPRRHPSPGTPEWETLRASLTKDYFDPLVWNEKNGKLVSGHLRQKVLISEGFTHADVSVVSYDEPTHLARLLAANRLQGQDNFAMMKDIIIELDTGAFDMNLTGYSNEEIETMMLSESSPNAGMTHEEQNVVTQEPPASAVKTVLLIFQHADHEIFAKMINALAKIYVIDNVTDVVVKAVKNEHDKIVQPTV